MGTSYLEFFLLEILRFSRPILNALKQLRVHLTLSTTQKRIRSIESGEAKWSVALFASDSLKIEDNAHRPKKRVKFYR